MDRLLYVIDYSVIAPCCFLVASCILAGVFELFRVEIPGGCVLALVVVLGSGLSIALDYLPSYIKIAIAFLAIGILIGRIAQKRKQQKEQAREEAQEEEQEPYEP